MRLLSAVTPLACLAPNAPLEHEHPVFAAHVAWAHAEGGPITRMVLDALPAEWEGEHLVVDSQWVWLQIGQSLPTPYFHHEPYPGRGTGAYGVANLARGVEHVACGFGAPSARTFLEGEIDADLLETPSKAYAARDAALAARVTAGTLRATRVATGTLHRYGFGTYLRSEPATAAGLHFWIRVTRGSTQPIVNGHRNLAGSTVTGPWERRVVAQ